MRETDVQRPFSPCWPEQTAYCSFDKILVELSEKQLHSQSKVSIWRRIFRLSVIVSLINLNVQAANTTTHCDVLELVERKTIYAYLATMKSLKAPLCGNKAQQQVVSRKM